MHEIAKLKFETSARVEMIWNENVHSLPNAAWIFPAMALKSIRNTKHTHRRFRGLDGINSPYIGAVLIAACVGRVRSTVKHSIGLSVKYSMPRKGSTALTKRTYFQRPPCNPPLSSGEDIIILILQHVSKTLKLRAKTISIL